MNDTQPANEPSSGGVRVVRQDFALRNRFDKHRSLSSSWGVLRQLDVVTEDHHLVPTIAAIDAELKALTKIPQDQRDDTRLDKIDAAHTGIEAEMREFAAEVSKEALHRTLPDLVQSDRGSLIDFLDLMLSLEEDGRDRSATRAATTGFVISLLCMDGPECSGPVDPISLSPRLFYLCERAEDTAEPGIEQTAAALLAARDQIDLHNAEGDEPDAAQQHRREIGEHFFVPLLLRAYVAYRSAELMRAFPYHASTRELATHDEANGPSGVLASPFETEIVPKLAAAVRRRMAGESPHLSAIDRVAWCIDLDFPNDAERKALESTDIGTLEDIPGTTILVGLLCRSAEVIAEELEPIGISFDRLTEDWVKELNDAMKKQSDQLLVDDYKRACALSELRTKFLFTALSDASREQRVREPMKPRPSSSDDADAAREFRKEARDLASKAVANPTEASETRADEAKPGGLLGWVQGFPREMRIKIALAAAMFALLAGLIVYTVWPSGEMQDIDPAWLAQVSPHLVEGVRNDAGQGESFVGEVDAGWRALPREEQQEIALTIVGTLQASGLRNVMVYDDLGELRIQAFGEGAPQVVLGD